MTLIFPWFLESKEGKKCRVVWVRGQREVGEGLLVTNRSPRTGSDPPPVPPP